MLQESIATNLCTVMADSMDQAKFKCPRLRDLKSKLLSTLFRPRLHCGGTWCHGRSLALAISDECMPKDSVIQIEQVARVLNAIYQDCNTPLWVSAIMLTIPTGNRKIAIFWLLSFCLWLCGFSGGEWLVF